MIKVQIFSVETFLVEKLPGRIYTGNPFTRSSLAGLGATVGERYAVCHFWISKGDRLKMALALGPSAWISRKTRKFVSQHGI